MNAGIAVGGPKAGSWIECDMPQYYCIDRTLTPIGQWGEVPLQSVRAKEHVYRYWFAQGKGKGVWIHESIIDLESIIKELVTHYRPIA